MVVRRATRARRRTALLWLMKKRSPSLRALVAGLDLDDQPRSRRHGRCRLQHVDEQRRTQTGLVRVVCVEGKTGEIIVVC